MKLASRTCVWCVMLGLFVWYGGLIGAAGAHVVTTNDAAVSDTADTATLSRPQVCVVQIMASGAVLSGFVNNPTNPTIAVLVPPSTATNVPVSCQDLTSLGLGVANQESSPVSLQIGVFTHRGTSLCTRGPFTLSEHGARGVVFGSDCEAADLVNGSFETGTLSAWDIAPGSVASVITSLGPKGQLTPILPADGQHMAFLSTAGNAPTPPGTAGSVISQTFNLPADASTLSFCYQYVSNDSQSFENFFLAQLLTSVGTFTLGSADNAAGSPAGGALPPPPPSISAGVTLTPAAAPVFLSGINILGSDLYSIPSSLMTARVCSSLAVPPAIRGTVVTLRFTMGDVQDTAFDSAVVVDAIQITATAGDASADAIAHGTASWGFQQPSPEH
jgi:hypothetical protein